METQVPGLATTYRVTKEGQGGKAITPGTSATLHATGIIKETGECCQLQGRGAPPTMMLPSPSVVAGGRALGVARAVLLEQAGLSAEARSATVPRQSSTCAHYHPQRAPFLHPLSSTRHAGHARPQLQPWPVFSSEAARHPLRPLPSATVSTPALPLPFPLPTPPPAP
jgi:hypothetical protein